MSDRRRLRDHPLAQLTLVRYREFYREPEAIFWVFIFPILLTAGLGIAFRSRAPEHTRVAVAGHAEQQSKVVEALRGDSSLIVQELAQPAAEDSLRSGQVALLVLPRADGGLEYRFDPERPESRLARLLVDAAVQRAAGRSDPVRITERQVREAGARYVDFVVPGLLGMNLMGSGIWGIGFAIVDARRKNLLKRLIATPMRRSQYLASFLLSRLTFLCLEVALLLGFAVAVFGVPIRGSLGLLAFICFVSALAFASLGLLIAARPRTVEGVSGLMNLFMLPMWIFSGVFFSSSRVPDAAQPFVRALPLTAVIDALRATMLRGAGVAQVLPELLVIGAWLVVGFALAVRLFRWR
jgi:ABC-2 type transport system permease protein